MEVELDYTNNYNDIRYNIDLTWSQIDFAYLIRDE
jgi:hypothetical protein